MKFNSLHILIKLTSIHYKKIHLSNLVHKKLITKEIKVCM